jgi:hypothetical protein
MNFFHISQDLIGRPYALGDETAGLDCFNMILRYLEHSGIQLPERFRTVTRHNYHEFFLCYPKQAKIMMVDFFESILIKIPVGRIFVGDIVTLILPNKPETLFAAVVAANGQILAAYEKEGIRTMPLRHYEIVGAYRCRPRSH